MLKHSLKPVFSNDKRERRPTCFATTLYQFDGVAIPLKEASQRWRYLGRHFVTDENSEKVILKNSIGSRVTRNTPFTFCTKTTWNLGDLKASHPDGVLFDRRKDDTHCVPVGVFILSKSVQWRNILHSVSDPAATPNTIKEKILCFFGRLDEDPLNKKLHQHANKVVAAVRSSGVASRYLHGMTIYKSILDVKSHSEYKDTVIEFSITPNTGKLFAPILEQLSDVTDVTFSYGIFRRHHLIESSEVASYDSS